MSDIFLHKNVGDTWMMRYVFQNEDAQVFRRNIYYFREMFFREARVEVPVLIVPERS